MFYVTIPIALTDNDEDKSGYYVTLEIYQYRDDELIDKRIVENDFILRNFVYFWLNWFSGDRYVSASSDYKLLDVDNVERKFDATQIQFIQTSAYIRMGTGTTPVAVANYKLQTEVMKQVVDDGTIWVNGNQFNVTFDSTLVSDGAYTITETGINMNVADDGDVYRQVLICRDVFSGIEIKTADVIIIRYIFRFNL